MAHFSAYEYFLHFRVISIITKVTGRKQNKKCQKVVTDFTNWRRNYNCTKLANIFLINDTDSGKHGMTEPSGEHSAERFSKTSEMV